MPHIALPDGLSGITSAFAFRAATAKPMRELARLLLRGPNTLTSAAREMIAAFVSDQDDCYLCHASQRHGTTDLEIHNTVLIAAAFCMAKSVHHSGPAASTNTTIVPTLRGQI